MPSMTPEQREERERQAMARSPQRARALVRAPIAILTDTGREAQGPVDGDRSPGPIWHTLRVALATAERAPPLFRAT